MSSQAIPGEGVDSPANVGVDGALGLGQGGADQQQQREERHGSDWRPDSAWALLGLGGYLLYCSGVWSNIIHI